MGGKVETYEEVLKNDKVDRKEREKESEETHE